MAQFVGITREGFQDHIATIGEVTPATMYDTLIQPLYNQHITARLDRRSTRTIKTPEDAQNAMGYLKLMKAHNPVTYKPLGLPTKVQSPDEAKRHFGKFAGRMPEGYHPNKKTTYEKDSK